MCAAFPVLVIGSRADQNSARAELILGKRQRRGWFLSHAIDIDAANTLHAAFFGVSRWGRPAKNHLVASLNSGQLLSALGHALNWRKRRSSFTAGRGQRKRAQPKQ